MLTRQAWIEKIQRNWNKYIYYVMFIAYYIKYIEVLFIMYICIDIFMLTVWHVTYTKRYIIAYCFVFN